MNEISQQPSATGEVSIFDEVKPLPVYYSEKAIRIFCILFSVFFGSIMMAMNLKRTESKKGVWEVLIFGFVYSVVEIVALSYVPKSNSVYAFVLNAGGAYAINYFFWKKYIGADTPYTSRSVLVPAIIGIVVLVIFVAIAVMSLNLV